jgi:uncharacterized SAM-binding protein YcdF (DUF218 family)
MNRTAIVVLGSPNDAQGHLSTMAIERCQLALSEYRRRLGAKVIPTGGWGEHFNTTEQPHGYYLRKHLEAQGVRADDILECVESANTIEDAQLCRPVVERHGITDLIVITSDFHLPRARFLFEREFSKARLTFLGAKTRLPKAELARREQHEKMALSGLRQKH